jgi:8-oxo-dGTP diphosphatase
VYTAETRRPVTQSQGGRKPLMDDAEWYASLPSFTASAAALLTDESGAVLLVKPWYRDYWLLPGGVTEAEESPRQCAEREAEEEVGVAVTATALLAVHWICAGAARPAGKPPGRRAEPGRTPGGSSP